MSSRLSLSWPQHILGLLDKIGKREKKRGGALPLPHSHPIRCKTQECLAKAIHQEQAIEQQKNKLNQTYRHIAQLGRMGRSITECLNAEDIFATTCRHIRELMDVDVFAVGFHRPGQEHIDFPFSVAGDKRSGHFKLSMQDQGHPAVQCILHQQEVLLNNMAGETGIAPQFGNPHEIRHLQAEAGATVPPVHSALYVPLNLKSNARGVLCLYSANARAYRRFHITTLQTLAAYAAVAFDNAEAYLQLQSAQQQLAIENRELEEAYRTLEEVSLTDPLTGLRNRRFLQQHLDADIAITVRQYEEWKKAGHVPQSPDIDLMFFLIDIDHFKAVNDQYGHAAGDMVLIQMRERLKKVFRESDYLIRWGGEEFLVVARATSRTKAEQLANRIRHTISHPPFALGAGLHLSITCSIGFSCFPFLQAHPGFMPWQQAVQLADQGLYIAKRGGRDAWVGLYDTEITEVGNGAEKLIQNTMEAVQAGELQLVSSNGRLPHRSGL